MKKVSSIFEVERTKPEFIPPEGYKGQVVQLSKEVQVVALDIHQRYKNILNGYSGMIMRLLKIEIENISQNMKDASLELVSPIDTKKIFENIVLAVVGAEDFCKYLQVYNNRVSHMTDQNFIYLLNSILPELSKMITFQYLESEKIRLKNQTSFEITFIPPHLYKALENSVIALIKEVHQSFKVDFPELCVGFEDVKNEFLPNMQYSIYGMIACY